MSSMRFEPYHRRPCIIILHRRSLIRDRSWASATDGVFNIIPGHMAYVIGSTWWFHILIIMVCKGQLKDTPLVDFLRFPS